MKARRLWLVAVALLLGIGGSYLEPRAGNLELRKFILAGGSNTDSTEQHSIWIPIRGAQRVIIRSWSGKTAFHASTDADSTFSDSIAVFKVAFSDSMQLTNPLVAGDSVVITTATVANIDTTTKLVAVFHPPLQEALRGPGNGSGIMTWVIPVTPGLATADNNGYFPTQYMAVLYTPLRRMTVTGGQSTEGKRVNGLRSFRMDAYVVYSNK